MGYKVVLYYIQIYQYLHCSGGVGYGYIPGYGRLGMKMGRKHLDF